MVSQPQTKTTELTTDISDRIPWLNEDVSSSCVVLVAASGSEKALESPLLEHGVFTYSLLHYWDLNRDPNKNGFISVEESDLFASYLTFLIAQRYFSYSQHPSMIDNMSGELDLLSVIMD
jgi:hypothetical protein